jgi:hypothetical protein
MEADHASQHLGYIIPAIDPGLNPFWLKRNFFCQIAEGSCGLSEAVNPYRIALKRGFLSMRSGSRNEMDAIRCGRAGTEMDSHSFGFTNDLPPARVRAFWKDHLLALSAQPLQIPKHLLILKSRNFFEVLAVKPDLNYFWRHNKKRDSGSAMPRTCLASHRAARQPGAVSS